MDPQVQVALIATVGTAFGYVVSRVQKGIERYLGQKKFQKSAIQIFQEVREDMTEIKGDIDKITSKLESQRAIMKQLLSYSKQQTDAAKSMSDAAQSMSRTAKELINKFEEVEEEER